MVKTRKPNSATKDGFKQLEINQFFSSSSKHGITTKTLRLCSIIQKSQQKCSRQLFTESTTLIHDSSSESESENLPHKEVTSNLLDRDQRCEKIVIGHRFLPFPLLDISDSNKDLIINIAHNSNSSVIKESSATPKRKELKLNLNKPDTKIKSPEKLKPRILQAKSSNDSIISTTSSQTVMSDCSQKSTASDETIIYDVIDNVSNKNNIIIYLSPISKLISKVNSSIESTKHSSIAYKRRESGSPQKNSSEPHTPTKNVRSGTTGNSQTRFQTPKKNPKKSPGSPRKKLHIEDEYVNPRVVNLVTRIVKYVFTQSHLKTLFDDEEVLIFYKFYDMPQPEYQYLCYKLFTRLPKWYNIFRLCENIRLEMSFDEVCQMHKYLGDSGFIFTGKFFFNRDVLLQNTITLIVCI